MVVLAIRKLINMSVIECDLQKANSVLCCIYGNVVSRGMEVLLHLGQTTHPSLFGAGVSPYREENNSLSKQDF